MSLFYDSDRRKWRKVRIAFAAGILATWSSYLLKELSVPTLGPSGYQFFSRLWNVVSFPAVCVAEMLPGGIYSPEIGFFIVTFTNAFLAAIATWTVGAFFSSVKAQTQRNGVDWRQRYFSEVTFLWAIAAFLITGLLTWFAYVLGTHPGGSWILMIALGIAFLPTGITFGRNWDMWHMNAWMIAFMICWNGFLAAAFCYVSAILLIKLSDKTSETERKL